MNKKSKARRQPRRRPAARKVPEKPSRSRLRLIIAAAAAVVLAISGIVIYQVNRPQPVAAAPSAAPADGQLGRTVQENSRRLNDVPNAKATFVEFLDFECEACGSVYPAIEQIRETYGDRVAFVIRYFPLEGHFNSQRAARAVEAAAQQCHQLPLATRIRLFIQGLELAAGGREGDAALLREIRQRHAGGEGGGQSGFGGREVECGLQPARDLRPAALGRAHHHGDFGPLGEPRRAGPGGQGMKRDAIGRGLAILARQLDMVGMGDGGFAPGGGQRLGHGGAHLAAGAGILEGEAAAAHGDVSALEHAFAGFVHPGHM